MKFFKGFDSNPYFGDDSDSEEEIQGRPFVNDENFATETSLQQQRTEKLVFPLVKKALTASITRDDIILRRDEHITFLLSSMEGLSLSYASLDASKPWLCYWIVHSLRLLGEKIRDSLVERMVVFLAHCQNKDGGFGGGPQQLSHLAPSYAATLCVASLGSEQGFSMIDREAMYQWLLRLKQEDGSFAMHLDGEPDVRATYCALTVARLLNITTDELTANTASFIRACQTHEGGFGGSPGNEAHGGYTFCGAAAAAILGILDSIDVELLLQWIAFRQMKLEGGFCGRTNKLVDSCYSFWQGAVPVIVSDWRRQKNQSNGLVESSSERDDGNVDFAIEPGNKIEIIEDEKMGDFPFNQIALQEYLLLCCQNPKGTGGMIDKPGKHPDLYHTCYALSGLSLSQNNYQEPTLIGGNEKNLLNKTNPVYNVICEMIEKMEQYFKQKK